MKSIQKYEHQTLRIGEQGFEKKHWEAIVKLNESQSNKYFQVIHNGLKFNQYVGVIQVDNLCVQINPKIDKNEPDDRWSDILVAMLKICGRLSPETNGFAELRKQNLNLLEIYFDLFLTEIDKLIRLGLIKKYRKNTSNTKALKGKLEFAGNIRRNFVHKERFYTTHQVYDHDHDLHKVLFYTLSVIRKFTRQSWLVNRSNQLIASFPHVAKISSPAKIVDSIVLNRKSSNYELALKIGKLIIHNYSPNVKHGNKQMLSILFDMNELWEEYVLKILKRTVDNVNVSVFSQVSKPFWKSKETSYPRLIKPDIVVHDKRREDGELVIIDTKWKIPYDKKASIEDLKQMYVYNRFWNSKYSMLLYPDTTDRLIDGDYQSFYEDQSSCSLMFINILNQEGGLNLEIGKSILSNFGFEF